MRPYGSPSFTLALSLSLLPGRIGSVWARTFRLLRPRRSMWPKPEVTPVAGERLRDEIDLIHETRRSPINRTPYRGFWNSLPHRPGDIRRWRRGAQPNRFR